MTMRIALPLAALALALPLAAQRDRVADNDPSTDPYTNGGDPEVMAAVGVYSLGGFEFGHHDTAYTDEYLAVADIRWIETEHFEIGMALGPYRVSTREKEKIRAELTAMAEVYEEIDPRTKTLDPWLRAHMFGWRAERAYERFLELIDRTQEDFPDGSAPWDTTGEYMGEGPHLGQKGKYEILLLPSESLHVDYLTHEFGLTIKNAQRWNVIERDSITVSIHAQEGDNKKDPAMHNSMVFNLAHNFLDGYKHYNYDTPPWLHAGLAHYMEREISPEWNSFDQSEGGIADMLTTTKWTKEVQKLVRKEEAPRLAELVSLRNYAEFDSDDHVVTWSMVKFLAEEHPETFAAFLGGLCGLVNDQFIPDGSNMRDRQRELLRETTGMSYSEFDEAWRDWVLGREPEPEDDVEPLW